jgi:polysaccharide biosynthesis protein VpsQ
MRIFRRAAILFVLFLILVIIAADAGFIGSVLGWLYDFPYGDKVGHFILMGTLSLLVSLGYTNARVRFLPFKPLVSNLIIGGLVSAEELSQALFPGRSASFFDLLASLAGIFLMGELGAWLTGRRSRKSSAPSASSASSEPENTKGVSF